MTMMMTTTMMMIEMMTMMTMMMMMTAMMMMMMMTMMKMMVLIHIFNHKSIWVVEVQLTLGIREAIMEGRLPG